MEQIQAVFDGRAFVPFLPVDLKTNERVTLTYQQEAGTQSFTEPVNTKAYSADEEAKIQAAIKIYQETNASIGGAAYQAGIDKLEFEKILWERNIPVGQQTREEVMADVEMIRNLRRRYAHNL